MPIDNRSLILKSAAAAFSLNGYDGAAVREIAGRAGVLLSALDYHFGTKADLYRAVYAFWIDRVGPAQRAALAAAQDFGTSEVERRTAILKAYIAPLVRHARSEEAFPFLSATARVYLEPGQVPQATFRSLEAPLLDEFVAALCQGADPRSATTIRLTFLGLTTLVKFSLFDPNYASATGWGERPKFTDDLVDILVTWAVAVLDVTGPEQTAGLLDLAAEASTPPPPREGNTTTRDQVLVSARHAFARAGYLGASMRAILRQSKTNPSSVYTAFGDKLGLYIAVVEQGLVPLCEARSANIRQLSLEGLDEYDAVAAIVRSYVEPHLLMFVDQADVEYMRIMVRMYCDPAELLQEIHKRMIFPVRSLHLEALVSLYSDEDPAVLARLIGLAILQQCLIPFSKDFLSNRSGRFGPDIARRLVELTVRQSAAGILRVVNTRRQRAHRPPAAATA